MNKFMVFFALLFSVFLCQPSFATTKTLLSGVITTGAGTSVNPPQAQSAIVNQTFQAFGTVSASTGSATVLYQGSNDNVNWKTIGTITLTLGTAATNDVVVSTQNWRWVRGNVTALTGTTATVTALVNY